MDKGPHSQREPPSEERRFFGSYRRGSQFRKRISTLIREKSEEQRVGQFSGEEGGEG